MKLVSEERKDGMLLLYLYQCGGPHTQLRFAQSRAPQKDHHVKWPQMRSYLVFSAQPGLHSSNEGASYLACSDETDV